MRTIVILETDSGTINPLSLRAVTFAQGLGHSVVGVLIGYGLEAACEEALKVEGLSGLLVYDDEQLSFPTAERYTACLETLCDGSTWMVAAVTGFSKDILPRVAARAGLPMCSNVLSLREGMCVQRPSHAGHVIETVRLAGKAGILTVLATAYPLPARSQKNSSIPMESLRVSGVLDSRVRLCSSDRSTRTTRDLSTAHVIVSGGKALGSAETFCHLLNPLAEALDAAIGATRSAVDLGYAPNDWQIGQTGKVVSPDLYIAIGLSGAAQHLAGMSRSKTIIAINIDPEAPICQAADYVYIGDLFQVVPLLTQRILEHSERAV